MTEKFDHHSTVSALQLFRSSYSELDTHVDRFADWLSTPSGGRLMVATTKAYVSAVRSTLVKLLILQKTPTEVWHTLGSSASTAWRLFFAFTRLGGMIKVAADGEPFFYRAPPNLLPTELAALIRRHTSTKLGDLLESQGIGVCIRAMWPVFSPHQYANLLLGNLLREVGGGLHAMISTTPWQGRGLPHEDAPVAVAAVYMALWSYAGDPAVNRNGPLLRAIPAVVAKDIRRGMWQTPAPVGLWDVAGRPGAPLPTLPPEGEALLRGEAIDLSGVVPFFAEESMVGLASMTNPRWAAQVPMTQEEVEEEQVRVRAFHTPTPPPALVPNAEPGWNLTVDVRGVPALGEEGDLVSSVNLEAGEANLTAREDGASQVVVGPEVASVGAPDFDAPELPFT